LKTKTTFAVFLAITAGAVATCKTVNQKRLISNLAATPEHVPHAPPQDRVTAWHDFKNCLARKRIGDVASAIDCVPVDCRWVYVDSNSAQNACKLQIKASVGCSQPEKDLVLPRVLVECGEGQMVLSWGFCGAHEHLEVGNFQTPESMLMYDLSFPNPDFAPLAMDDENNKCNTCHFNDHPFLHTPTATIAREIIATGRINQHIDEVCRNIRALEANNCDYRGVLGSQVFNFDRKILNNLCKKILKDE
jgi:hypothetical protein